ncbi:hypothetical protein [Sorangium sp. So ce145]|uniref:hypothetical protein n=1 Tax=Sorangium sp. So ce145 TaxID=3133285 RepID=UPI003F5E4D11
MGDYRKDLQFGRKALAEAECLLLQLSHGSHVIRSQDRRIHEFTWSRADGEQRVLVRVERQYTGNFFLETKANNTTQRPGWMVDTRANLVLYGFGTHEENSPRHWYLLEVTMLRGLMESAIKSIAEAVPDASPCSALNSLFLALRRANSNKHSDTLRGGTIRYRSSGILLPIYVAEQAGVVLHHVVIPYRGA